MQCFIKSFAAFKTVLQLNVIASSLCMDSSEAQGSTVTVAGEDVPRSNNGAWLIIEGQLFLIDKLTPQDGRTLINLVSPVEAFSRKLLYSAPSGFSIGGFIQRELADNWINQSDGVYALPYMVVENVDVTAFAAPALDADGLYSLADYIRQVRRMNNVKVSFTAVGDSLRVRIEKVSRPSRNVVFNDGHTQLQTAAYSRSGIAKLTVYQRADDGTVAASDWYLAADGTAGTSVPAQRAAGEWDTLVIDGAADPLEKVLEKFAKNSASHKIEFWSDRLLDVYDNCTFYLYGELLNSHISYVGKRSTDKRYLYRSGELATTATEKMKGVMSK